jgi:hypothetical protein
MDSVNNRSLFQRRSQGARDKVRQMGGIQEPQGILASFQELMEVAGRNRTQNLMPQMMQPQQPPVGFQMGGDIALEAYRQGLPEPSLGEQIAANPAFAGVTPVNIAETPTPRARSSAADIVPQVREMLGDNEEAQAAFSNMVNTISDPEATDEDRQQVLTESFGAPNSAEGLRAVVSQITGRDVPASATVDELNDAIAGVALGGAIGGPRSVAARISEGLLVGLQAKRETAMGREQFEQQLALEAAKPGPEAPGFLETPRGKAAVEMYQNFLQNQNMTPEQAYARMDQISPGLGSELGAAMAGTSAVAPGAVAARSPEETAQILQQAREAIAQNRDRSVVEQMLRDMGVDPAGL